MAKVIGVKFKNTAKVYYFAPAEGETDYKEKSGVVVETAKAPKVGGTLTYASLGYDSVYGRVTSAWRRDNGTTTYTVSIPANTTATVILPDGEHSLGTGKYEFKI